MVTFGDVDASLSPDNIDLIYRSFARSLGLDIGSATCETIRLPPDLGAPATIYAASWRDGPVLRFSYPTSLGSLAMDITFPDGHAEDGVVSAHELTEWLANLRSGHYDALDGRED